MSRKILVLPIFKKYWICHAWASMEESGAQKVSWLAGATLEEKIQHLGSQISNWATSKALGAWTDLEKSKPGTIKNRVYKLAKTAISRDDPEETFLRSPAVSEGSGDLEIIYPSSIPASLIRRRMRLLLRKEHPKYRSRLLGWSLASIPLIPLLATPIPNLPLYYAVYRAYSLYKATSGCSNLEEAFGELDRQQLQGLRAKILAMQGVGHSFDPDSWPAKLVLPATGYHKILESSAAKLHEFYKQRHPDHLIPHMVPSTELDEIVRPSERFDTPLSDAAVKELSELYGLTGLEEVVERARKRAAPNFEAISGPSE